MTLQVEEMHLLMTLFPRDLSSMKFARYWAEAVSRSGNINAHGWSDESEEAAQAHAQDRLQKVIAQIEAGAPPRTPSSVYYDVERPPREEQTQVLEEEADEGPAAIISRNNYGCLVLNTKGFALIDLDRDVQPSLFSSVFSLFGGKSKQQQAEAQLKEKVSEWMLLAKRRGRLYRTAGGFRLALIDRLENPLSEESQRIMQDLGADPLFCQLCRGQESFRARLTPKPWRVGHANPPHRYPWATELQQKQQRSWENTYAQVSENYAVCELVEEFGRGPTEPLIARLLKLHDDHVLNPGKPLA